jgi:PKD repeat protein
MIKSQVGLFINGADASLRVDSTSFLSVAGDFQNMNCDPTRYVRFNGSLYLAGNLINNDVLKFNATTGPGNSKNARIIFTYSTTVPSGFNSIIGGSVTPNFWEVEFDKTLSGSVTLSNNINCSDTVNFKTGFIYMNGYKWNLVDPVGASIVNHPYLKNERQGCQFMPSSINDTGLVRFKTIYTLPTNLNPANIGITITGSVNIGSRFEVTRGFKPQVNAGKSSILRYFDVYSPGHGLSINHIQMKYVYNDFAYFSPGYFNLPLLKLFVSNGSDLNWSPLASTVQNTLVSVSVPNGLLSANLSDLNHVNITIPDTFFRITIADPDCPNLPSSAFLQDTLHVCTGNTITIDAGNNSPVPNASLRWEWNTNPILYTQTHSVSPNLSYQKFVVKLMDARGCVSKDSVILAPQAPYPQITYFNHLNSCLGDSVSIKDTVKINSGSYANTWLFSDATTSSSLKQFFKKKFSTVGEHSIQLTSTSNYGCSVSANATNVVVYPLPTASFSSSLNCTNGVTNFINTAVSNHTALIISSSFWNLGQGSANTATLFSPSQTYSSSGTYTVKLNTTSSFGCKDSVSNPIIIYPTNQAVFSNNNSCFNDTVFFNNNSACNTGSCSYEWSFGDVSQSLSLSPKKVYTSVGFYNVKLKVTNPFGCPDSISKTVFVNPNPNTQFISTNTTVCLNEFLYFTNTSSVSSGSIFAYTWDFGNSTSVSSTNAAVTYSNSGMYTVSLTAVSDSGCVNAFTIPVIAQPQPTAQYNVSNVCSGSPSQFVSNSNGSGLSYVWNFGNSVITSTTISGTQNYIYPLSGTYSTSLIAFNIWGCSDTTSLTTTVYPTPLASLGGSVSTCGTSYTLNAGNVGSNYLWQPLNQLTQTVQITSSGIYNVNITNTNNCIGSETVQVTLNAIVKPLLGNDTTVCGSFYLNAGYPGSSYAWNTGSSNQIITANTSSAYIVQVMDGNGCLGSDTINLIVNTPASVTLGNDLIICKPKYGFVLTPTTTANNLLWNTGSTSSSITLHTNGTYWLEGTALNGCKKRDSITVNFLSTPQINLGSDKSVCGTALLDAQNIGAQYIWSNGETHQTTNIHSTGNYWVTVTNTLTNCFQQDSIEIIVHPLVSVFLGNDTTLCNNAHFMLNANNSGASYDWTSGDSTQFIPITSSGIYGVKVTNSGGCFAADYISISLVGAPIVNLGNRTQYLCGNNNVELELVNTGQITWGSTNGLSSTSNSLTIAKPGKYWATVKEFGCYASDSILIVATNNTIQALFLASTIDTINKPVKFVNLSEPLPTSQLWIFGDGLTSTELSPIHTYVLPQNFSVTLEVSNGFCIDRITKELNVLFKELPPSILQPKSKLELLAYTVWPNPTERYLQIDFELNDFAPLELQVFDITGKLIAEENSSQKIHHSSILDLHEYKSGLYILRIVAHSSKGDITKISKFIKTN